MRITLHDPDTVDISRAYNTLTGESARNVTGCLQTIADGPPTGHMMLGDVRVSWEEPDDTGMTPVTLEVPTKTVELYGHTYTCRADESGKITHMACRGRWAILPVGWLGVYDKLMEDIQRAYDAQGTDDAQE
jgi:hypothetical protein